jgi:hypothetical protein
MKRPLQIFVAASLSTAVALPIVYAQHHEERHEEHREEHRDERHYAPRPEPPKWNAHQPGVHPHGAMVRGHQVRVLAPKAIHYGAHPWKHWEHPEFARPHYYWAWNEIHSVTCVAEDSYGDQYPVTLNTWAGFGLQNMSSVEDDALDRCYAETQGDQSCFIATCTHY